MRENEESRGQNRQAGRAVRQATDLTRRKGWAAALVLSLSLLGASLSASPAAADEYEAADAGHPLRIIAYVLHPVGVVIDYVLLRPAHWIGSKEPFTTLFGHED